MSWSSSSQTARRSHGVCRGSLWRCTDKSITSKNYSSSSSSSSSSRGMYEYCVLVGVRLSTYESHLAYEKGCPPLVTLQIVAASCGANGGGAIHTATNNNNNNNHNNNHNNNSSHGASSSTTSTTTYDTDSFRLLTHQGTHVVCTAPTKACREIWLSALLAGLENHLFFQQDQQQQQQQQQQQHHYSDSRYDIARSPLSLQIAPPEPPRPRYEMRTQQTYCASCAKLERLEFPLKYKVAPLAQYGMEHRVDLCPKCCVAQGVLDHVQFMLELYQARAHERTAILQARAMCMEALTSGGMDQSHDVSATACSSLSLDTNDTRDTHHQQQQQEQQHANGTKSTQQRQPHYNSQQQQQQRRRLPYDNLPAIETLTLTSNSNFLLDQVLQTPQFLSYQRRSPTLEAFGKQFRLGLLSVMDFLELMDRAIGKRDASLSHLKKEAFRVAGDLGTVMKLLLEQTSPKTTTTNSTTTTTSPGNHTTSTNLESNANIMNLASVEENISCVNSSNTEMLQCLLEFLLDLAEDGELQTLAFFWPQLCHMHVGMLPPENFAELARVELVEDFLLTVATRYSVHMGIELIWSHTADLEDSFAVTGEVPLHGSGSSGSSSSSSGGGSTSVSTTTNASILKRRFALIRFICELESLLFDFDNGWGGGSVCVGAMLTPSMHQVTLLRETMMEISSYRYRNPDRLSRSVRLDQLEKTKQRLIQQKILSPDSSEPPTVGTATNGNSSSLSYSLRKAEELAQEALRIARNADYLSSHLAFTKRLCDIAEKLRFMEQSARSVELQGELAKLNSSGTMGGDPLNMVRESLIRVVRLPISEGHVFRSKERTPVLLLMEVVAEEEPDMQRTEHSKLDLESTTATNEEEKKNEKDETVVEAIPAEDDQTTNSDSRTNERQTSQEELITEATNCDNTEDTENSQTQDNANSHNDKDKEETNQSLAESNDEEKFESGCMKAATTDKERSINKLAGESNECDEDPSRLTLDDSASFHSAAESVTESLKDDNDKDGGHGVVQNTGTMNGNDSTSKAALNVKTECSSDDSSEHSSLHALRRFDSPKGDRTMITPTPSKETVERIVTNVVAKQLHMPSLSEAILSGDGRRDQEQIVDETVDIAQESDTTPRAGQQQQQQQPASQEARRTKRMSALGIYQGSEKGGEASNPLAKTGDTRREVLNAIMMKGKSNTIAAGATTAALRHLQDLERRRAVELLLIGKDGNDGGDNADDARQELLSLGIRSVSSDPNMSRQKTTSSEKPTEEDEAMEAVRLLLIQYRVAQGDLSAYAAAEALSPRSASLNLINSKGGSRSKGVDPRDFPQIDAGDVDARLVGCGVLPPAVLQALTLWKGGMVTNGELLELIKKDLEYVRVSIDLQQNKSKLFEDSVFWGRFAFGERWAEKQARIAATSPEATQKGWDLMGVIVKSNDDLRQEAFVMQLIELCQEAFQEAGLELWLHPYRILSTGRSTGIIEMVRNAMSFDALKKRPGYGKGGLREHLQRMTDFSADPGEAFKSAQHNFVRSLAAYSLLSYLFLFKDRHNGNILLDTSGHVIHIDFGFVFGIAPGGSFSLEMSTPFKLTEEMIEVMDGLRSSLFSEFVTLFCCGFLALQAHCDTFLTIVEITCTGSTFKCFDGRDSAEVTAKLRERFQPDLGMEDTIAFALEIIKQATHSYGTKQYDYFQYISQGIAT